MAYSSPSLETILGNILRDIRNLQAEADIGTDSDNYVRSAVTAAAIEGLYQKIGWVYRQIFPDTADEEELVHAAAIRGVRRKAPVATTGEASITGAPGVQLLIGASLKHLITGEQFTVQNSSTLDANGKANVTVKARYAGSPLNHLSGDLIITSPPLGMDATATFIGETSGGEDLEKPESLLARLLEIIQNPPAGGAVYDFVRWAKEVDGVTDVLPLPKRRGAGTVDLVITASGGLPSAEVVANCREHVLGQCSVIADVWVYGPTVRVVNAEALVEVAEGYKLADVQIAAQKAFEALLGSLRPREMLKRSQVEAMINNLAGVTDRSVTAPVGNVKASEDPALIGWIRPGTIALGLLE